MNLINNSGKKVPYAEVISPVFTCASNYFCNLGLSPTLSFFSGVPISFFSHLFYQKVLVLLSSDLEFKEGQDSWKNLKQLIVLGSTHVITGIIFGSTIGFFVVGLSLTASGGALLGISAFAGPQLMRLIHTSYYSNRTGMVKILNRREVKLDKQRSEILRKIVGFYFVKCLFYNVFGSENNFKSIGGKIVQEHLSRILQDAFLNKNKIRELINHFNTEGLNDNQNKSVSTEEFNFINDLLEKANCLSTDYDQKFDALKVAYEHAFNEMKNVSSFESDEIRFQSCCEVVAEKLYQKDTNSIPITAFEEKEQSISETSYSLNEIKFINHCITKVNER